MSDKKSYINKSSYKYLTDNIDNECKTSPKECDLVKLQEGFFSASIFLKTSLNKINPDGAIKFPTVYQLEKNVIRYDETQSAFVLKYTGIYSVSFAIGVNPNSTNTLAVFIDFGSGPQLLKYTQITHQIGTPLISQNVQVTAIVPDTILTIRNISQFPLDVKFLDHSKCVSAQLAIFREIISDTPPGQPRSNPPPPAVVTTFNTQIVQPLAPLIYEIQQVSRNDVIPQIQEDGKITIFRLTDDREYKLNVLAFVIGNEFENMDADANIGAKLILSLNNEQIHNSVLKSSINHNYLHLYTTIQGPGTVSIHNGSDTTPLIITAQQFNAEGIPSIPATIISIE